MSEQPPVQGPERSDQISSYEGRPRPQPRIYVASLSDYNAGRLYGCWLDAAQDSSDLQDGVAAMLAASREPVAEDWAIHDHEGFGGISLSEHESLEAIARLAAGLLRHGRAFAAFASWVGLDDANVESFEQQYRGQWTGLGAYADELLHDYGAKEVLFQQLPAWLQPYVRIDIEAFGRDLQLNGDIYVTDTEGGVCVFDTHG